jgi:hypothetical protein
MVLPNRVIFEVQIGEGCLIEEYSKVMDEEEESDESGEQPSDVRQDV